VDHGPRLGSVQPGSRPTLRPVMLILAIIFLAELAVVLDGIWTAPEMDDDGRIIGPSLRDQSK
jgi:hypothetical protein